jgi:hypothetical protein
MQVAQSSRRRSNTGVSGLEGRADPGRTSCGPRSWSPSGTAVPSHEFGQRASGTISDFDRSAKVDRLNETNAHPRPQYLAWRIWSSRADWLVCKHATGPSNQHPNRHSGHCAGKLGKHGDRRNSAVRPGSNWRNGWRFRWCRARSGSLSLWGVAECRSYGVRLCLRSARRSYLPDSSGSSVYGRYQGTARRKRRQRTNRRADGGWQFFERALWGRHTIDGRQYWISRCFRRRQLLGDFGK